MTIRFELEGQLLLALNGAPDYPFTEAISLMVNCETEEGIDKFWSSQ